MSGGHTLLRALVEQDIAREGKMASTMVRAGLLRDILDQHAELLEVLQELFERPNGITTALAGNPAAVDALERQARTAIARATGAA